IIQSVAGAPDYSAADSHGLLEAKIVHDGTHPASREIVSQSQSATHLVGDDITQPIVLLAKIAIARASRKNEDMGVQNFSGKRVVLNMRSGSVVTIADPLNDVICGIRGRDSWRVRHLCHAWNLQKYPSQRTSQRAWMKSRGDSASRVSHCQLSWSPRPSIDLQKSL